MLHNLAVLLWLGRFSYPACHIVAGEHVRSHTHAGQDYCMTARAHTCPACRRQEQHSQRSTQ